MKTILAMILVSQFTLAKTDLKGLVENTKTEKREIVVEKAAPQKTKKQSALIKDPVAQDVAKLRESLKGINLVLNNQPNSPNRLELLLKKSFLHVTIVREQGRNRTSATQLTEDEIKHLTIARDILNKLLQPSQRLPEDKKASVYYLLGLIAYEYENYKLQQKYFIEALKIDPKGPQAGSLALMIAEQYFDDEDFQTALKYYGTYFSVMNDKQKDLALYKSAWCYISMQQVDKAEIELLKVVQSKRESGFQKDSLRDLAFIAVRHRDELGIIRFGQQKIVSDTDRNEFYSLSLKYFFQMQYRQPLNRLISLVLKSEQKLEARLEILGHQVNEFRRDYLNPQVLSYFQGIRLELEKNKKNLEVPELVGFRKTFLGDMEFFIYSISKAYQSNPTEDDAKPVSKSKIAAQLEKTILFYDYFFPESRNKILVYQLLSDLCVDAKSFNCITQVYNKAKAYKPEEKAWNDLRTKLRTQQLAYADEMYSKEPEKYEASLIQIFNDFRKDYPNHPLVLMGLKKILVIYAKRNDTPTIEKIYTDIYAIEKTPENLYNLALVIFKQERYPDVVNLTKEQFPNDAKLNELRSETYLKLADKESQSDNFKNYEAYIIEILKTNKDQNKATLLYQDWLQKSMALKEGGYQHALEVYNSMPANIKSKPAFDAAVTQLAAGLVLNAEFEKLGTLNLNRPSKTHGPLLNYYKLVQFFANKEAVLPNWVQLLQGLEKEKRSYLLGLLVLTKPNMSIDYIRKTKATDENAANLLLLSLKIKNQRDDFEISPTDKKLLGALASNVKPKGNSQPDIVVEMKKLKFPTNKMKFQTYNSTVEALVPGVKKIREKILKSIKNLTIEEQLLIIPEAEVIEAKTAKALEEAPLPPGLDEVQKADYQAGVNELAKEFVDQSLEYKKLFDGLSEKMIEITKQRAAEMLPEIDMAKWPWPNTDVTKKAQSLVPALGFNALVFIDSQLADKKLSDDDYTYTRVGLLGVIQNSDVMRSYIKQELEAGQKQEIINKWKSLGPAVPAAPPAATENKSS